MNTRSFGIAAATLLALAACDSKQEGTTVGQKVDQAIGQARTATEQAKDNASRGLDKMAEATREKSQQLAQKTDELAQKAERAGERAGDEAKRAGERAGEAADRVGEKARRAGERAGDTASDASITAAVKAQLAKDPDLSALRIDVDTHDGKVALSGSAPSEAARQRAQEIAQGADGVTGVDNRLAVAAR
jgi:hyperosmotically inducible protein